MPIKDSKKVTIVRRRRKPAFQLISGLDPTGRDHSERKAEGRESGRETSYLRRGRSEPNAPILKPALSKERNSMQKNR